MKAPRTTLRRKLVRAIMLTSTVALVLTGAVLVSHDFYTFRRSLVHALVTRATMLGANSTAALAFQNSDDATQVLSALRADPSMVGAALYDERGRLFATYPADAPPGAFPRAPEQTGERFEGARLVVFRAVSEDGRRVGTLYLQSDLRALEERIRVNAAVVVFAMLASIGVAFVLSTWLQRSIAQPVLTLTDAARRVRDDRDYTVRVAEAGDDEVGFLSTTFNDMVAEIQGRETALRTAAARLRSTLDSALDGIVTMDHEGNVAEFNPAAEKMFHRTREEAVGAKLADLIIPAALRESHRSGLAHYLETGKAEVLDRRLELTAVRRDGSEFPVEVAITRVTQEGPPLFTGFIRDITERLRAEREIRQLNEDLERRVVARTAELEASNRELEAFSYSVSHDLRAPLRAIDGFSKALLDDCSERLDDDGKRHLDRVRSATRQMAQLIDDMLKLAHLSRTEMTPQRVDLSALGRDIAASLQQAQPDRAVRFEIAPGLVTEGDPHLLRIAFDNLLRNAWKFTSRRPSAHIEVGADPSNGERVYFVRDDGAGFDMAHAQLLFTPFQRLHRQSEFEGTGIGLATVQRIIQRHGGRLWAKGAVDHGATFYFTLSEGGSS
ncbi:MAG TPA: PAS domain S-box protein [Candidatus Eisenbacteria bacterium]